MRPVNPGISSFCREEQLIRCGPRDPLILSLGPLFFLEEIMFRDFWVYTRRWEKAAILSFLFFTVFGACQMVETVKSLQTKVQAVTAEYDKYRALYEQHKGNIDNTVKALSGGLDDLTDKINALDKDQDGKISLDEMLLGLGGVLGLMQSRNVISNRKKKDDKQAIWNAINASKTS
jgi:hypothetical protein